MQSSQRVTKYSHLRYWLGMFSPENAPDDQNSHTLWGDNNDLALMNSELCHQALLLASAI